MSDSASSASSAAAAPASSSSPAPSLVQADTYDFVPGAELFVRGQKAVCVRLDYPHVYWQWASDVAKAAADASFEAPEKHRSCSATPALFSVRAEAKRTADSGAGGRGGDHMADTSDDDEENEAEQQQRAAGAAAADSAAAPASDSASDAAAAAAPAPASDAGVGSRASLMSMFARRPEKCVISGLHDAADETISSASAAPQAVSIEHCERTHFTAPAKLSQLTLLGCSDVEVTFLGVISSVELIRCTRCTLTCQQAAATFTLDDSDSCSIRFPGRQQRVMFVTTESSPRTTLTAAPGQAALPPVADDGEAQPADIDHEVRFVIEPPAAGVQQDPTPAPTPSAPVGDAVPAAADAAASAPASSSNSGVRVQYQTVWENGAFSTRTLERQGALGYFANN